MIFGVIVSVRVAPDNPRHFRSFFPAADVTNSRFDNDLPEDLIRGPPLWIRRGVSHYPEDRTDRALNACCKRFAGPIRALPLDRGGADVCQVADCVQLDRSVSSMNLAHRAPNNGRTPPGPRAELPAQSRPDARAAPCGQGARPPDHDSRRTLAHGC